MQIPALDNPLNLEDISQLALVLFEHTEQTIARADEKAQVILTADALLAAALTLSDGITLSTIRVGGISAVEAAWIALTGLLFAALLVSVTFAVLVAAPILSVKGQPRGQKANLFFFGDITALGRDAFIQAFVTQAEDDARFAILSQVHAKSTIAASKLGRIRHGARLLVLALLLWGAAQVLRFVAL